MPRFLERLLARTGRDSSPVRRPRPRWHRPKLEALEDRANPVALSFVPFSVVAANQSALPPTSLLQFNPLPELSAVPPAAGAFQSPIQVQGTFQQSLVPAVSAGTVSSAIVAPAGHLDVTYSLQGSESGTVSPAGTAAAEPSALSATFSLTGRFTAVLVLPGAVPQPAWSISGTFTEHGSVTGPLYTPASSPAGEVMSFTATIGITQTEASVAASSAVAANPWSVQATVQSAGTFQVSTVPPPVTATTVPISPAVPFSVQDQITQSLSSVAATSASPQPPIKITGVDSATGTVTENAFPPGSLVVTLPGSGTTQYKQQLSETITYSPGPTSAGSTQTVNEALDTSGVFQNVMVMPVPAPDLDLLDSAAGTLSAPSPGSVVLSA